MRRALHNCQTAWSSPCLLGNAALLPNLPTASDLCLTLSRISISLLRSPPVLSARPVARCLAPGGAHRSLHYAHLTWELVGQTPPDDERT